MLTDQEILAMDNVPPRTGRYPKIPAASYLDVAALSVYFALQQRAAPYGYAVKNPGGKWSYSISPGLLVAYKRGTLKIEMKPA